MKRTPNPHSPEEVRRGFQRIQFDTAVLSEGAAGEILIGAGAGTPPTWTTSLTTLTLLTVENITINAATITSDTGTIGLGDDNLTTTGTVTGVNVTSGADPGHTHSAYQPSDADLTAIAALTGTTGFLKKTAENTWSIDTTSYTTDHGGLSGLGDDDHTQYHNDTRGDARYYTETELNAGQLDTRYFTETEHLNISAGAGDAGKPIKLDAAGHVDATMLNDGDIDHGSIGGLADDDHTAYHTDARAVTWLAANHENTYNHANYNTAYGWGNHAIAGYLTSETSHADVVVDGDFTSQGIMLRGASAGTYAILTDASTNWNTAYGWGNHAIVGYLTAEADTLNSVTGRGATTANSITVGGLTDSALTAGRVPYASTAGLLVDSANLTFSGTLLTTSQLKSGSATVGGSIPADWAIYSAGRFGIVATNRTFYFSVNDSVGVPYAEFSTYKYDDATTFPMFFQANGGCAYFGINTVGTSIPTTWACIMRGRLGLVTDNLAFYLNLVGGVSPYAEFSSYKYDTGTTFPLRLQANGGNVGIGLDPLAVLHLKSGTATAGTAPLKLTAGTNLTTPEAGAIEFDGTNLYFTDSGGTRRQLQVV